MPFSRSRSIESRTRSTGSLRSDRTPACRKRASTSVVLPWSTWAMTATLRSSSLVARRELAESLLMSSRLLSQWVDGAGRDQAPATAAFPTTPAPSPSRWGDSSTALSPPRLPARRVQAAPTSLTWACNEQVRNQASTGGSRSALGTPIPNVAGVPSRVADLSLVSSGWPRGGCGLTWLPLLGMAARTRHLRSVQHVSLGQSAGNGRSPNPRSGAAARARAATGDLGARQRGSTDRAKVPRGAQRRVGSQ